MLRNFLPELEWAFTSTSPRSPGSLRAASRFSTSFFNQMTYMSNSPFLFPLQIPCRGYSRLRSIMRYIKYSIVGYKSQAQTKDEHFCCFHDLNLIDFMIKNFSVPQRNRQFVFIPKIEYKLIAEPRTRASSVRDKLREANLQNLQFPQWSPREESNPHQRLRRALLCPLSYEGNKWRNHISKW